MTTAVIGAGIVGACVAHELLERGEAVTLIERAQPGEGASYGNSAAISPASIVPLAMPGILKSVPKMLLDPEGALRVAPLYLPRALPWLLQFLAAAKPERVEQVAKALLFLHQGTVEQHQALARKIEAQELIAQLGHLYLYPDEETVQSDAGGWRLREQFGIPIQRLGPGEIGEIEPAVNTGRYPVGFLLPTNGMVLNPRRYVQKIVESFVVRGGIVLTDEVRQLEARSGGGWSVAGSENRYAFDRVVLAAGVQSKGLLDDLGLRVPLESQRGYHAEFKGGPILNRTCVLANRKAFVAPLETGMRIAGTVEIAGIDAPPNMRRAEILGRFAREAFTGLPDAEPEYWMGHRPCFPDYLPAVGEVAARPGLWVAIGHGHLGVTDSVTTAKLIGDAMLAGKRPPELAALALERFA